MRHPPGWLEPIVRSGEYKRLAAQCVCDDDLALRLGVTAEALQKARKRLRLTGLTVPTVQQIHAANADVNPPLSYGQLRGVEKMRGVLSDEQNERLAETWGVAHIANPGNLDNRPIGNPQSSNQDFLDEILEERPGAKQSFGAAAKQSFDAEFDEEEATQPNARPYFSDQEVKPPVQFASGSAVYRTPFEEQHHVTKKLTREDCPDGTLILWASDIHIPIQNDPVCRLMVECAERSGVTRVIAGGDILDMNCLSTHAKESRRSVEHATILDEVEPGRWLLDWFATKQTDLILGNHEDRLKRFVDENPAFHGSIASNFAKVCELPAGINVLDGEVRLGNLSLFHGHAEFKNGTGGKYPAQKILDMFPDQSSICGHLHRMNEARRTTQDEYGVPRTRKAITMGHLSHEHMHYGYVSRSPNWQVGFAMIRVFWEGDRPRWNVYPVEVLFDRYGKPYFEWNAVVYR